MERVMVIGCPGSGKSTFSRALAEKTGLPLCYMDMLFWNADKTHASKEEMICKVDDVVNNEAWIIDGNYLSTMEMRFERCDTVFFLNYPLDVCLSGVDERRGKVRPDMPWVEPIDQIDEEFLQYIREFAVTNLPTIERLIAKYKYKNVVEFKSRDEAKAFLDRNY